MLSFHLLILTLASIILMHTASGAGVPEGWRQSDRFVGFRYMLSVSTHSKEEDVTTAIQNKADQLFCFGWIQNNTMTTPINEGETLVGEARCQTNAGSEMKAFLSSLAAGEGKKKKKKHIVFKDYEDTLIRLHFSHFKIVSPGRNTCFRDEPHQCLW